MSLLTSYNTCALLAYFFSQMNHRCETIHHPRRATSPLCGKTIRRVRSGSPVRTQAGTEADRAVEATASNQRCDSNIARPRTAEAGGT